jgi:polar amino acid transport system permease protein
VVPAINVEWSIIAERIFSPDAEFWRALVATVSIAIVAQVLGIALGLISALAGLSRFRAVRVLSAAYVLVIRGTPLIVQIFFVFFGANLFFGFSLFPRAVAIAGLTLSGAILAGTVALAINEGAYMSEIIRAGIQSVDPGQMEAALSVGMTRPLAMRRIVLPQAARVIVPPLGNEFNGMIKNTSLLAFIGVYEMFFDAETHYSTTFKPVEYFLAVAFWYLVLTTIWSIIQTRIERRLDPAEHGENIGVLERARRLQWGRAH